MEVPDKEADGGAASRCRLSVVTIQACIRQVECEARDEERESRITNHKQRNSEHAETAG